MYQVTGEQVNPTIMVQQASWSGIHPVIATNLPEKPLDNSICCPLCRDIGLFVLAFSFHSLHSATIFHIVLIPDRKHK